MCVCVFHSKVIYFFILFFVFVVFSSTKSKSTNQTSEHHDETQTDHSNTWCCNDHKNQCVNDASLGIKLHSNKGRRKRRKKNKQIQSKLSYRLVDLDVCFFYPFRFMYIVYDFIRLLFFVRPLFVIFFVVFFYSCCCYKRTCTAFIWWHRIPVFFTSHTTSKINPFLVTTWHDSFLLTLLGVFLDRCLFYVLIIPGATVRVEEQQQPKKLWEKSGSSRE